MSTKDLKKQIKREHHAWSKACVFLSSQSFFTSLRECKNLIDSFDCRRGGDGGSLLVPWLQSVGSRGLRLMNFSRSLTETEGSFAVYGP